MTSPFRILFRSSSQAEYRAVALEMFSDWQMSIGRHTPLAVAARTEDAS